MRCGLSRCPRYGHILRFVVLAAVLTVVLLVASFLVLLVCAVLVTLLLRLSHVREGRITLDGSPIEEIRLADLRASMGLVSY